MNASRSFLQLGVGGSSHSRLIESSEVKEIFLNDDLLSLIFEQFAAQQRLTVLPLVSRQFRRVAGPFRNLCVKVDLFFDLLLERINQRPFSLSEQPVGAPALYLCQFKEAFRHETCGVKWIESIGDISDLEMKFDSVIPDIRKQFFKFENLDLPSFFKEFSIDRGGEILSKSYSRDCFSMPSTVIDAITDLLDTLSDALNSMSDDQMKLVCLGIARWALAGSDYSDEFSIENLESLLSKRDSKARSSIDALVGLAFISAQGELSKAIREKIDGMDKELTEAMNGIDYVMRERMFVHLSYMLFDAIMSSNLKEPFGLLVAKLKEKTPSGWNLSIIPTQWPRKLREELKSSMLAEDEVLPAERFSTVCNEYLKKNQDLPAKVVLEIRNSLEVTAIIGYSLENCCPCLKAVFSNIKEQFSCIASPDSDFVMVDYGFLKGDRQLEVICNEKLPKSLQWLAERLAIASSTRDVLYKRETLADILSSIY